MKIERFRSRHLLGLSMGALLLAGVVMQGCNLFGDIDDAENHEEIISEAQALMDDDQCGEAITRLEKLNPKNDEAYQLLGWAQMCAAGATLSKVGSSILTYNASSTSFTVVGNLATSLVPSNATKVTKIREAIRTFEKQSNSTDRALNLAFGRITEAAAIIAKSSSDGFKVVRGDLSNTNCGGVSCGDSTTNCAVTVSGNMSDTDANEAGQALLAASQVVGGIPGLGAAADLANRLGAVASSAVAQFNRCTIYNQMFTR